MPWFVTTIKEKENGSLRSVPEHRTMGFYDTYVETQQNILENRWKMRENYYDYIVVEYIESGIFPKVMSVDWWEWCESSEAWERLLPEALPKQLKNITNWALG